jgi:hypothetical protein
MQLSSWSAMYSKVPDAVWSFTRLGALYLNLTA